MNRKKLLSTLLTPIRGNFCFERDASVWSSSVLWSDFWSSPSDKGDILSPLKESSQSLAFRKMKDCQQNRKFRRTTELCGVFCRDAVLDRETVLSYNVLRRHSHYSRNSSMRKTSVQKFLKSLKFYRRHYSSNSLNRGQKIAEASSEELDKMNAVPLPPGSGDKERSAVDFAPKEFPKHKIRNFSIIAHIDHGKSTLADRMMEMTGAIIPGVHKGQYLDKLQVERERGITVKAQTASLIYTNPIDKERYLLNLIDTPGHVDFSYEVSRSLAACDGCLLLVDSTQGVQAQTVANFFLAFEQNLAIVPVLNKIDMDSAEPEKVAQQIHEAFDVIEPSQCLQVSAKSGLGVDSLLQAIVEEIPCPDGNPEGPTRLLLFDAFMDTFRGVICLITVVDGLLKKGDRVVSCSSGKEWEILEIGILSPEPRPTGVLLTGQVGYVITGMKNTRLALIGDTWHLAKKPVIPLPGFREPKSMVFAGIYPISADEFDHLNTAIDKLTLNDSSVSVKRENSAALGAGFRCGFLGLLHMDVFRQRLEQEHNAEVIVTAPTVPLKVELSTGEELTIESPADFPSRDRLAAVWEPMVQATILVPTEMVGSIMTLCQQCRGEMKEHQVISNTRALLRYDIPLSELGGDFYDELKGISKGLASFDYEEGEYRLADLVRMDVLVNGDTIDALARVVHRSRAVPIGRTLCESLRSLLDRQQFDIALQTIVNGRVVARETIKAYRKNVLAKCYGGDITRKKKLLEKQKEGKKRMRKIGTINVPAEALHSVMRAGSRMS